MLEVKSNGKEAVERKKKSHQVTENARHVVSVTSIDHVPMMSGYVGLEVRQHLPRTTTMQNPKQDIEDVLDKLITTKDPDEQKKAMGRYFAENAAFQSPFYKITPHQQSREDALGVYQLVSPVSSACND